MIIMEKIKSLGGKTKIYLDIILTIFFKILYNCSYQLDYNKTFREIRLINTETQKELISHYFIHCFYCSIGIFFISIIFYRYNLKNNKDDLRKTIIEPNENNSKKTLAILLIITILLNFEEIIIILYQFSLKNLDFWMLELLIINFFNTKIFHKTLYIHQKFSLAFNIIPCILKIITIILSFINSEENEKNKKRQIYIENIYLIPLGIIIYLILLSIHSYSITKIKWLMDLRYISLNKILLVYGLIGTITYFIFCLITTFLKCPSAFNEIICKINYDNKNNYYLENFFSYYNQIKTNNLEIIYEILVNFIGVSSFILNKYFSLLIIKKLSPIHIIFITPIYFFIKKIILPLNTLIFEGNYFLEDVMGEKIAIYFLDIIGDVFSLIGFMIFFEIIELNFCGLNYDIKKSIEERAILESEINNDKEKKFLFLDNGDIEEINYIE